VVHSLPEGLQLVRVTPQFTKATTPPALRVAHRVAKGVWGLLVVRAGRVRFTFDDRPAEPIVVHEGESVVIPPDTPHSVDPDAEAVFVVEFYR
jgi:tellurite resistance-related uncharacterized protein